MQLSNINRVGFMQHNKSEQNGLAVQSPITEQTNAINSLPDYKQSVAFGMSVVKPVNDLVLEYINRFSNAVLPYEQKEVIDSFKNLDTFSQMGILLHKNNKGKTILSDILKNSDRTVTEYFFDYVEDLFKQVSRETPVNIFVGFRNRFIKNNLSTVLKINELMPNYEHPDAAKRFFNIIVQTYRTE